MTISTMRGSRRSMGLFAAGCLAAWALSGTPAPASTQDAQPAPAPEKKAAAKKTPDKSAKPAKKDAKAAAAATCEPSRSIVPANKNAGVCAPPAGTQESQKFNTFEDIYVPPAPPAAADGK